jgi:uracil-DNA glycosylase/endonuclease III
LDKLSSANLSTLIARLHTYYPNASYELDWATPEEMLIATTLAAQCTDERVNRVTATLFNKYPSPQAYLDAPLAQLEEDLKPTGFYKQKAQSVRSICEALVKRFNGKIPQRMEDLITIRGVARKTANVVLNNCFNIPSGIIVDTHVARISPILGLSDAGNPEAIERDLMALVPQDQWTFFGPAMVLHGRYTCKAKAPECHRCVLLDVCPRNGVSAPKPAAQALPAAPLIPPRVNARKVALGIPDSAPAAAVSAPAAASAPAPAAAAAAPAPAAAAGASPALDAWVEPLLGALGTPKFKSLLQFVAQERADHQVFPPADEVFTALELTPLDQVKVVILGQDPYHDDNQAHGLSFSVKRGIKQPPSLVNIFKELKKDLGINPPKHGCLEHWAKQGVLMLNAVLTVRAHEPNSHKDRGWEAFTDEVIRAVSEQREHVVFLLWGAYAQKKGKVINTRNHTILRDAHPSPLSATKFFGSKPFSKINAALEAKCQAPIDWRIPD